MTQYSYFHNGTTLGDATEAPYSTDLFSDVLNIIRNSNNGYFVPNSGAFHRALVDGRFYDSTGANFAGIETNNSTLYYRLDAYVVRVNRVAHTARLAIKMGSAAEFPQPPSLIQTAEVFEIPIYYFFVAPGGNTPYSQIDQRQFINNAWHSANYTTRNRIINGLFYRMDLGLNYPYWTLVGTADDTYTTSYSGIEKEVPAGSPVLFTATGIGGGIRQTVRMKGYYTLKCHLRVLEGEVTVTAGAVSVKVRPTLEPLTVYLRGDLAGTATNINIDFLSSVAGTTKFILGGVSLTDGYVACPTEVERGIILYKTRETPVIGTGLVGPDADIILRVLGTIPKEAKAALLTLQVNDSGSAGANDVYVSVSEREGTGDLLRVDIGRLTNSVYGYASGWIPLRRNSVTDESLYKHEIRFLSAEITDMDAQAFIWGIVV